MERPTSLPAEGGPPSRRGFPLCALVLAALVVWQGWMTLSLFGGDAPCQRVLDDQPIISGSHAQNLYLGMIGAQSLLATGHSCCLDPAFQAGYPKTPVFNGSRLSELFLLVGGGGYQPAAYKVGMALLCLFVPFWLVLACRGTGLGVGATCLATAAGLLVWWGNPGRRVLESGEVELFLGALAVLAHVGLLLQFDRAPGVGSWIGLLVTGAIGWLAQPLLFPILLPLLLIYYLSIGAKHRAWTWHLALLSSQLLALAVNLPWLVDWVDYWWLRAPLPLSDSMLRHRTFQTLWDAPLWGGPVDRALAMVLLGSAAVGVILLNQSQQRPAARLLGLGAGGLLVLALLGISWEPLGQIGTAGLLVPALWFAALPAAYAWVQTFGLLRAWIGRTSIALLITTALLLAAGVFSQETVQGLVQRLPGTEPWKIGLGTEREELVRKLALHTGPEARILWEDRPGGREMPRWSPLLPVLTGRSYIGGLDPAGTIEHAHVGFIDQALRGLPISTWSDAALEDYCRRYNVGWVVSWTPATTARFRAWSKAELTAELFDQGLGYLFTIRRLPNYFLKGRGEIVAMDATHITLADVVPDNGVVVLSLHYQSGLRASPSRVQVERESDPLSSIGFIRLRTGPAARVTLTWDER
jgi:hypothetical protein